MAAKDIDRPLHSNLTSDLSEELHLPLFGAEGSGDETAPIISGDSFDDATDTASFTVSEAGTLYWATSLTTVSPVPNGSGGWTGTTLETGNEAVVQGANNLTATITATTGNAGDTRKITYYVRDAAGNDSAPVSSSFVINSSIEVTAKGVESQSFTNAKTINISGNSAGDFILAIACQKSTGSLSTASTDWTEVVEWGADGMRLGVYKYTGAGTPSSMVVNSTTTSNFSGGYLVIPAGSTTGTPTNTTGGVPTTSTTGNTVTAADGDIVVHVIQHRNTNALTNTAPTPVPSSEPTLPAVEGIWAFNGGNAQTNYTVIIDGPVSAGTTDACTVTHASGDNTIATFTVTPA